MNDHHYDMELGEFSRISNLHVLGFNFSLAYILNFEEKGHKLIAIKIIGKD